MSTAFEFNLYRLNIVDEEQSLFESNRTPIRGDSEIVSVLKASVSSAFDETIENKKTTIKWSLREFTLLESERTDDREVVGLVLARSLLSQAAPTVTDLGIEAGRTEMSPPSAIPVQMLFYMKRHIVAVEHHALIFSSDSWRHGVREIFRAAAESLGKNSVLALEPITAHDEILKTFRSFSKLTRLKVKLRLPNPEVTRITERLVADMRNGGVREYLQQMYNPAGLSQDENALPHASATLAQQGYKEGEVVMEGDLDGKRRTVRTGLKGARTGLSQTRDFVKGALANAKSKEARTVLTNIIRQIDEVAPESNVASASKGKPLQSGKKKAKK